jgi:hypothetical protein
MPFLRISERLGFSMHKTAFLFGALVVCSVSGSAQQMVLSPAAPALVSGLDTAQATLPDAPSALLGSSSSVVDEDDQSQGSASPAPAAGPDDKVQTKRILGIMPNFRSVSRDTKLPAQTAKEKFIIAGHDTFDYSSFFIAGIQAGFAMNGDSYPEFHQGLKGYGRYYWHTLADTIDENFMVGGVGPAVFHTDNRFYTLGHGSFFKRTAYATSRVIITRKDNGAETVNLAELIGAGAAAGISSTYYPTKYQTWTKVGQKWLTGTIIDGANFMLKEFWPDINHYAFHRHDSN